MKKLTKETCRQALMGGLLLGGGGGGLLSEGFKAMEEAFSYTDEIVMLDVEDLDPDDTVVTISTVGAPSAFDAHLTPEHWMTSLRIFTEKYGKKAAGFISCENGAISTANGWILSALKGIPMVDAPSNGRAHPTGTMGSMGLNILPDYITTQSACGGKGALYVETVTSGALGPAAQVIRASAAADGGMVGVVRNPVPASYLKDNAAVGAISQAIEIGKLFEACGGGKEGTGEHFVRILEKQFDAKILLRGTICNYALKMEGGYDIGSLDIRNDIDTVTYTFWNENMFVCRGDERIATFPDLICMLDATTGESVSTAEARDGRNVYAIVIPKEHLILGAGMHQRALFEDAEKILGADMTACNEGLFI